MAADKVIAKGAKQHTVYKLKDGTRVPGVTTFLGVLAKPALIAWANKMGLQGIDTQKYVERAADAGTAAHEMIECHLKGLAFDRSQYPEDLLSLAENGAIKYLEWESQHTITKIESELALVSEIHRYGGTIDLYCELDGKMTLVDFKTNSTGVYDEMRHQVVAYARLLEENKRAVERIIIIRLGKSDQMDMEAVEVGDWDLHWKMFQACQTIYETQKQLRK
jgi:hypothetical protein